MENTRALPVIDRTGEAFEIGRCGSADLACLMDMYHVFSPKPASQGLPPPDSETCEGWAKGLLEIGENLLARKEEKVIGHAVLIPNPNGDSGEFVIFVHQDYRNLGVGTHLTRLTLERGRELGMKSVWLTVAITNFVAIRLYRKVGFEYCDMDDCERTMIISLGKG
ncbi:MAG: GNAT family N-acetyltransferase [Desulfobacterales bacterium]|nr:GNAT family N-acetyltransferase [Desulfobacterales bacterium]